MKSEQEVRNYLKKLEADIRTYQRELRHSTIEKRLLQWILNEENNHKGREARKEVETKI